jgi:hypothetical protein
MVPMPGLQVVSARLGFPLVLLPATPCLDLASTEGPVLVIAQLCLHAKSFRATI